MSRVISLRLPDETAERLQRSARQAGRSVNEMGVLSIEEWLRQNEFAGIEFRSFGGQRHACLKGALQVWQLIMVAQSYGMSPERTAEHFGWSVERVLPGFHYYEAYPDEINQALEDNDAMTPERMKRLLPTLHVFEVPGDVES